jgi:hypothetical protein
MNRSFPPPTRAALCALAAALVSGAACTPNQSVKPGAPELIEFIIVQTGPRPSTTVITPDTTECPTAVVGGEACLPMGALADVADGGMFDADVPPDTLCRQANAMNWCTCVAGMDPMVGTWQCPLFASVVAVIAVFDRVLFTEPLAPEGGAAGRFDLVTASSGPLQTDYSATGQRDGFIFNLIGPLFGNFRGDGPSLLSLPQPAFPSAATVTVTLQADKILAKDGTTPFIGKGLLQGREVVFSTAPFHVDILPPDPDPNAQDRVTATVAFTNFTESPGCFTDDDPGTVDAPCAMAAHITTTSNAAPIAVHVASGDGATYSVKPRAGAWPAGATVVISVDGTVQSVLNEPIDMASSLTFTAP